MVPPSDMPALAARFQRFGAFHEAQQLYRLALEHHPDDAELWASLGRVCHALGHDDDAATSFRRSLNLRPDRVELHNDLGVALMAQGRLDEAVVSFREAVRLRPDTLKPTTTWASP